MHRLIVMAVLLASADLAAKEISTKTVDRAMRSVVAVACAYRDPATGETRVATGLGSGFFIARDGTFITAAHVVAAKDKLPAGTPACELGIYVPKTTWRPKGQELDAKFFRVRECRANGETDLAACRPVVNPFETSDVTYPITPMELEESELPDGAPIAFTGFPLNSIRPMTSIGHVSAYRRATALGSKELVIDKAGWPGASGSPVYDQKGRAIGMILEIGGGAGAGLAYARTSVFIRRFLTTTKTQGD